MMNIGPWLLFQGFGGCHGDFGQASTWGANEFYRRVPQSAESPPALSPEEMFLVVRNGVRYSGMGAWKDLMPEEGNSTTLHV